MTPIVSATLLRTQSDARLAALARQGYERAFEAIVERYRRPLHRHVRRILPESRTEDAVQQTFLKAWTAIQDGPAVKDLKPWLYRIAHNTALDALKRAGYDYDELTDSLRAPGGPEADLERRAVIRETLAGVAALPENQREALLRTAVAGQSRAQVASELGLTDGAVRQLVHRARVTLRAAATAITPLPVAAWASGSQDHGGQVAERVAELAVGGGAAGGAGMLLKGGAVIVASGVLAVGPVALKLGHGRHRDSAENVAAAATLHGDRSSGALTSGQGFLSSAGSSHANLGQSLRDSRSGAGTRGQHGGSGHHGRSGGDTGGDVGRSGGDGHRGDNSSEPDNAGAVPSSDKPSGRPSPGSKGTDTSPTSGDGTKGPPPDSSGPPPDSSPAPAPHSAPEPDMHGRSDAQPLPEVVPPVEPLTP
jgi:RNA polymerase sigma factor (sigma-70 family)